MRSAIQDSKPYEVATMEWSTHLILYDGLCGLCNRLNQFVLARDPHHRFQFASLQSPLSKQLLAACGRRPEDLDTLYVVIDYKLSSQHLLWKARAALYILAELGGPWKLTTALNILPTFLLDLGYDLVARNRYRLFGKYESCLIPGPGYNDRFLDV
jgi:predicted DCC family thiol-disulfide oxidoreductase YuxK